MLCLAAGAYLVPVALACSVPVFRYGLEHWKADPYRVFVVHRGALSGEQTSTVGKLHEWSGKANVAVLTADLDKSPAAEAMAAWQLAGSPSGEARMILLPPPAAGSTGFVWSGLLAPENVDRVMQSPARSSIISHLGEGESAAWVLLESGDKAADDAAASLLQARLAYLSTVLELPKLDEQDIRNGLVSVPPDGLRLSFSIVRVSRSDPAEEVFVQMLLATEPDLKESEGPMVFPVFGQGRALYALVGKGIKHETIDEAASFLIGSCSCQVKEKNPGADLLMAADWKGLVRDQATGLADLPSASEIVGGAPETVTIAPKATTTETEAPEVVVAGEQKGALISVNKVLPLNLPGGLLILVGAVVCLAAGGVVLMMRGRK